MENLKTLVLGLYVLLLLAIIWKGFRMAQRARETNAFEPGTFPGHMSPPKPPSRPKRPKAVEDNWVRDGSVPELWGKHHTYLVIVEGAEGTGIYFKDLHEWVCWGILANAARVDKVDAWQKFPDYEKI